MKSAADIVTEMTMNVSKPTDASQLRALYAAVKAGAAMPHALVRAALNGLTDKACAAKARDAFYALGLSFAYGTEASLDDLDAAAERGDYLAIVRLSSGFRNDLWAAAMSAHYGPCGTHKSRCNADDTVSAETLAEFPRIGERMTEARASVASLLSWYRRNESHFAAA